MKNMKKIFALVLAVLMVAGMIAAVAESSYGATNEHTITIDNTDQNVSHNYKAYQVFKGNLNANEELLSDIQWGTGVKGAELLAALKASTDPALQKNSANVFAACETPYDVAKVLSTFDSTAEANQSAGAIDAVATIIAAHLDAVAATFTEGTGNDAKKYTATVQGDGYYFIQDETENDSLVNDSTKAADTLSKYLLRVIKDTTIVAKDTGITPDKKILGASDVKLAADSSAIGDTITFNVEVDVPNTMKYEDHFVFHMNDTLPAGMTFTGIKSIKVGTYEFVDSAKNGGAAAIAASGYDGTTGYYTLKVNDAAPAVTSGKYAFEAEDYDAVAAEGGQSIKIIFNEFKKVAEKNGLIGAGKKVVIQYTAVLNDDAEYKATANENEVTFDLSNDPNHDYNGDEFSKDDPKGTTPESKTRTYTTSIKILKVDEQDKPLPGAEFTLTGTMLNRTVKTGVKFVLASEAPATDFEDAKSSIKVDRTTNYYLLKDGSYTSTAYDSSTMNDTQYASTTDIYYKVTYKFVEEEQKATTIVLTSDDNGIVEFVGLQEGTDYTLEETHSPDGYNKIDGKVEFKIEWTDPEAEGATSPAKDQGGFTLTETSQKKFNITWNETDKQFEAKIENKKGVELPSTGGIGTTLFYVGGGILILLAVVLLVTKRRMSGND